MSPLRVARLERRPARAARRRCVSGPRQRVEVDHGAVVVAEVAQQPPEPLGAAERAVRDDEDAGADPGRAGRAGEVAGRRQRMAPARARRSGEVALDVEERGAGMCPARYCAPPEAGVVERPAAVDEPVPQRGPSTLTMLHPSPGASPQSRAAAPRGDRPARARTRSLSARRQQHRGRTDGGAGLWPARR